MQAFNLKSFWSQEDGSATLLSVYMVMIGAVMTGLAVDFQKRQSDKTHLQVAADSVAHGALYLRETLPESEAKSEAVGLLNTMLPRTNMQTAITYEDITFGTWDAAQGRFAPLDGSSNAVRVYAGMTETRGNPTPNLILRTIGFDGFDVAVESVYATYYPPVFSRRFCGGRHC